MEAELEFENTDTLEGSDDIMNAIDAVDTEAQNTGANGTDTSHAGDGTNTNGPGAGEGQDDILSGLDTKKKDERAKGTTKPQEPANKGTQPDTKDKDYPEAIKGQKAREHFDTLKAQKDDAVKKFTELDTKHKALEQEVQKLRATSGINGPEVQALNKEVADLKKQLEEKEKILAYKAVEDSTPFIDGVKKPIQEAENTISQLVSHYQLNESMIDKAIAEPNKFKRNQILREVMQEVPTDDAVARTELSNAVTAYQGAIATERQLRENAKGNRDLVERETKEAEGKKNVERLRSYEEATKGVEETLRQRVPELFQKDDKGTESIWSAIQAEASKVKDFDAQPARSKMFAHVAANSFIPLVKMTRDLKAKLEESEKALKDLQSTLPGAGSGSSPSGDYNRGGGDEEDGEEKSLLSML